MNLLVVLYGEKRKKKKRAGNLVQMSCPQDLWVNRLMIFAGRKRPPF